jgi:hypothetical protein
LSKVTVPLRTTSIIYRALEEVPYSDQQLLNEFLHGVTAPAPVPDGVNSAIVMDVVGHQSTAVSTHYTTIDSEAKRRAIERMPDILRPPRDPQDIFVHPIKFL